MEKTFWLARQRASEAMARDATHSKARLIHLELAGRYGLKAASADDRIALQLPRPPSLTALGQDGEMMR